MPNFTTHSSNQTIDLGARLARALVAAKPSRRATVIALTGDLGAGKTTFTKGLYKGFGSRAAVSSPTFILMRRTRLARGRFKNIFHVDAYRLGAREAMRDLGLAEIFRDPKNVVVVEWAERLLRLLPKGAIRIRFRHAARESDRWISIMDRMQDAQLSRGTPRRPAALGLRRRRRRQAEREGARPPAGAPKAHGRRSRATPASER